MAAKPSISLFDVFIGRGRTIRNPTGPPGVHWRDPNKPRSQQPSAAASAEGNAPGSGGNGTPANGTPANSGLSNRSQRASVNAGSNPQNGDTPQEGEAPQDATAENNNQADAPNPNSNQNSNNSNQNSKGNNSNDNKGKKGKKNKKSPAQSFTEEQDVRLIRLVGEDKNWREIAKELQKPQPILQKRYEDINPFKHKAFSPKPSPKDTHTHTHTHKHKHSRTHSRRAPSAATHAHSVTSTAYTMPTMVSLTEDENFSYGEIAAISELIERDMGLIWDRVSAGFYDMTGRRIGAEDIRGKFGGLGGGAWEG